ncbi:MAG: 3'(2'),5'-bisphosphate nucleotidase CysQ [Chitinophagales bacterium]
MQQADLHFFVTLMQETGAGIMRWFRREVFIDRKSDDSPVTIADREANNFLVAAIGNRYSGAHFITEESPLPPYEIRRQWSSVWLIDPLDGTKEFIRGDTGFTVNVALIENGMPVFGMVYAPALNEWYLGGQQMGSYKSVAASEPHEWNSNGVFFQKLSTNYTNYIEKSEVHALVSNSHATKETADFLNGLHEQGKTVTTTAVGSSLKTCRVAAGLADIYPRFGPTSEWDTAAAHAVAIYAGRKVVTPEGIPLQYNKPDIINPAFLVY